MQKIILDNEYRKIHFIGIGGVSMSALAVLLKTRGFLVQGSDNNSSKSTEDLEKNGIKVFIGHKSDNISDDVDIVVYTVAIKTDNEELVGAREKGIQTIDRAKLLGMIIKNYKVPIAVAGTHGKSTTTSIISKAFLETGLDPTINVGGFLKEIDGNLRDGSGEFFIFEACEYYDSFLQFFPKIGCILNVELDHVDYFKDFDSVIKSFNRFAKNISNDGYLIINNNIKEKEAILSNVSCNVFTVGNSEARLYCENIKYDDEGYPTFDIIFDGKLLKTLKVSQVGEHNIFNTLTAIAVFICAGVDLEKAFESTSEFTGINRRFQIKGEINGAKIIDDYAHHPTEIEYALKAQREATKEKTYVVFQPHTYSRTKEFYKEFAKSLEVADIIILVDIYAAREKNEYNISSKDILNLLLENNKDACYFDSHSDAAMFIKENIDKGDSIITMGAGDVYKIGDMILEK